MAKSNQTKLWLENYNDSNAFASPDMVGDGYSNVGRNYSPAWGGQFEEGGEIPNAQKGKKVKYVESKNDPRYKAYQDSVSAYNTSIQDKNETLDFIKRQLIKDNNNRGILDKTFNDKLTAVKKDLDYNVQTYPGGIKPLKSYVYERSDGKTQLGAYDVLKKPQQQVIVKPTTTKETTKPFNTGWIPLTKEIAKGRYEGDLKNMVYRKKADGSYDITYQAPPEVSRQPVKSIQNNLQPAELVQGDFNIHADTEIHPEVRRAKYYDVEDYTQGSANYIGEQTNYRTSDLSTLSEQSPNNKRKITPRYQDGGKTFLQPTSDKLPEGYRIPYDTPSTERAGSIGGENGEPAYLVPEFKYGHPIYDPIEEFKRTGEHLGGPFKTWQEAEEWEETVRHPAVENRETIMFPQEKFAMGGSIPGSVGFTYARTKGIPSEGKYAKKTLPSAQNGKEMQYYQNGLDFQPKTISKNGGWLDNYNEGGIIKDDRGQWDHPGEITEIGSNDITMEGVPYDVLGISDEGDTKLMKPGKNYKFKGKKVTEYPIAQNGLRQEQKGLQNLEDLTNFTNYNKPSNWLNKYN